MTQQMFLTTFSENLLLKFSCTRNARELAFPEREIKIETKSLLSSRNNKGIKYNHIKEYDKFLKNENT